MLFDFILLIIIYGFLIINISRRTYAKMRAQTLLLEAKNTYNLVLGHVLIIDVFFFHLS